MKKSFRITIETEEPEEPITVKMPRGANKLMDLICPRLATSDVFLFVGMLEDGLEKLNKPKRR